jgi:ribonuclease T1
MSFNLKIYNIRDILLKYNYIRCFSNKGRYMKKRFIVRSALLLLAALLITSAAGCGFAALSDIYGYISNESDGAAAASPVSEAVQSPPGSAGLDERGSYYSMEDVRDYLIQYGHLPDNFITKDEARALGWEGGSVEQYAPGCAIGGDRFMNREGLLPKKSGREYKECDIDTEGKSSRGAKRIVFSNDGLIYYTDDHYESFALLYGEEN